MIKIRKKQTEFSSFNAALDYLDQRATMPASIGFRSAYDTEILQLDDRTTKVVTRLILKLGSKTQVISKSGEVHRLPEDPYDAEVGMKYAMAASLEALARTLRKQAEGKMNHNSYIAEQKTKIKTRNASEKFINPSIPPVLPDISPLLEDLLKNAGASGGLLANLRNLSGRT